MSAPCLLQPVLQAEGGGEGQGHLRKTRQERQVALAGGVTPGLQLTRLVTHLLHPGLIQVLTFLSLCPPPLHTLLPLALVKKP